MRHCVNQSSITEEYINSKPDQWSWLHTYSSVQVPLLSRFYPIVLVLLWIALVVYFKWERGCGRSGRLCSVNNWHLIFKQSWPNTLLLTPLHADLRTLLSHSLSSVVKLKMFKYATLKNCCWVVSSKYFPLPHPHKKTRSYNNQVHLFKINLSPKKWSEIIGVWRIRIALQWQHASCHLLGSYSIARTLSEMWWFSPSTWLQVHCRSFCFDMLQHMY